MRLLLIGAPGSGKGTQAVRLAERFGITHISSGDLLRQHVRDLTPIGQTIKEYVDAGDLVPDSVVMDMLYKPCSRQRSRGATSSTASRAPCSRPRRPTTSRSKLGAEVKASIHLDVPNDELVRRLLARSRGSEDSAEVIEHRLQVYREKTVPLLDYYARREWLVTVDGTQSEEDVHESIARQVSALAPPASVD